MSAELLTPFDEAMLRTAVARLVPLRNSPTAMRAERTRLAAELGLDAKQLQAALGRRLAEIEDEADAIAALPPYWEVPAAPAQLVNDMRNGRLRAY